MSRTRRTGRSPNPKAEMPQADDESAAPMSKPHSLKMASRARRLAADENDPSLNIGPNGQPLFTSTPSLSELHSQGFLHLLQVQNGGIE
ncbi:hypothetical protein F8388_009688 [Cannabis sativa]|uniref:Uncharacterized protein n=1 Tax=Cannabis sativa TaxID=3483 RepID=A0A7J6H359_CANSA|nr:hypothetical protein F8388_009688 [Cannabis sativa]